MPRSPWPTDLYYTRGTGPAYTSLDPQAILGRAKSEERATPRRVASCRFASLRSAPRRNPPGGGLSSFPCFCLFLFFVVTVGEVLGRPSLSLFRERVPARGAKVILALTCVSSLRACVRACVEKSNCEKYRLEDNDNNDDVDNDPGWCGNAGVRGHVESRR